MGDRQPDDDDRDDAGRDRASNPSFPLLFPEERPSLLRRMVGSLADFLPVDEEETALEEEPRQTPRPPEPPPVREPLSPSPPAEGLDPAAGPVPRLTLQLLPGRLTPVDPEEIRQEVRFLRAGPRQADVTLGWAQDDPPGHVTLDHPSVLPHHARMRFRDDRWTIESLVQREPVRINGKALPVGEPRLLESGDRVRLGDVEFRFQWP